jgi:hypothetical protein
MWSLYGVYWPKGGPAVVSQRNQQLLNRLIGWHHIADGAFVGARDRSVRQIEMEGELLDRMRIAARELKPAHGNDRASFALALARRAFADPNLAWAAKPSPRSWWRGSGAGIFAKLTYVLVIYGLWLAVVWLVGAIPRWLTAAYTWLLGDPYPVVRTVTNAVSEASLWVLGVSVRGLLAVAALGLLAWIVLVALPALVPSWRRWLNSVRRELERPTETWSSRTIYIVGWLVGAPLVAAILAQALICTFVPQASGWGLIAVAAVAALLLACAGALFSWFDRRFSKLSARFSHPREDDVHRGQQVHPSIEACEAERVDGTAHMISLTDIRNPHRWSAWWIRASLRVVTWFGRVFFTAGRLGDAPGIHFGHWHIIDGGRRFLFCSNYDGNFGGYLDDFINGATIGTTLAWRWTKLRRRAAAALGQPEVAEPRSFPPTRFLIFRGVKCELKFKSYARDSMLPHLFHFDACNRTIDEINLATGLRDALFGERNDCNDELLMRTLE